MNLELVKLDLELELLDSSDSPDSSDFLELELPKVKENENRFFGLAVLISTLEDGGGLALAGLLVVGLLVVGLLVVGLFVVEEIEIEEGSFGLISLCPAAADAVSSWEGKMTRLPSIFSSSAEAVMTMGSRRARMSTGGSSIPALSAIIEPIREL